MSINRWFLGIVLLVIVIVGIGCSFGTDANNEFNETKPDTTETAESKDTEVTQDENTEKDISEAETDAEDRAVENDTEINNETEEESELEFADALRQTNDIIQTEEISKLPDGKQYTFVWNYETYEFTEITCDHTGQKYFYQAISDEIIFEAEFEQDEDDIQVIHYADEDIVLTDKNSSDDYFAYVGEYDIQIYNLGDQIVGVSMVHKNGVRDTMGEPIGFFISCTQ